MATDVFALVGRITVQWSQAETALNALNRKAAESAGFLLQVEKAAHSAETGILQLEQAVAAVGNRTGAWNQTLQAVTENGLALLLNTITTGMSAVNSKNTELWSRLRSNVSAALSGMQGELSARLSSMGGALSSAMVGMRNVFLSHWSAMQGNLTSVLSGMKSSLSGGMSSAYSGVSTSLVRIRDRFQAVMDGIYSAVNAGITKVKSLFNFTWSLPSIKLPHFSIKPSGWKLSDLLSGTIPTLGISWYAKAMDDGMIMNSPTVFGINGGQLMAGGEAGSETVVGTESLMNMVQSAVAAELGDKLDRMLDVLNRYFPLVVEGQNRQMVLDTGVLVGEMVPVIDKKLGSSTDKKSRGN